MWTKMAILCALTAQTMTLAEDKVFVVFVGIVLLIVSACKEEF